MFSVNAKQHLQRREHLRFGRVRVRRDIKRTGGDSASATPNVWNAKSNAPFCVSAGTTITFKSTSKDTGFVLDFGSSAPFDSGAAITGGADRPVSVVAKKPGCYTYSVGA